MRDLITGLSARRAGLVLAAACWDNVVLEALTYQDPDEAPFNEDDLSALDIVPHPLPPKGHFGCGQSCLDKYGDQGFAGSLDAVEEHERTCDELLPFLPADLWRDPSYLEEMALPVAPFSRCCTARSTSCSWLGKMRLLLLPVWVMSLRYGEKVQRLPEEFKHFKKIGHQPFLSPIDPVDKVLWEHMEALNQLDGAADDSVMEEDSADAPHPQVSQQCWLSQPLSYNALPL